jgi:glucans biosynthesis protein
VHRRELFPLAIGLALAPALGAGADEPAADTPFDASTVRTMARDLAQKSYQAPDSSLPDALKNVDYSTYQKLRFDKAKAIWRGDNLKFTVELFSRGYLFHDRVDLFEVSAGKARPIRYNPDMFDLAALKSPPPPDIGFAGFRVHYPLNRPDYLDEVCAFLGASYFRALARGQGYGLSARGLSIRTADPRGEEFPVFKSFWLEKPPANADAMVINALLDSPSAAAAIRFTLRPGADTIMDTEMALYPRTDLDQAGLTPMTSMFFFDANNRSGYDDYRNAVHDSHGLSLLTSRGEWIWRALNNPKTLQVSALDDAGLRAFGLVQRERSFADYEDLEAVYEKRPTLWVEPIGDWGVGAVMLVEIPSDREVNDNIVAFWHPKNKLPAKSENILAYRLHWTWDADNDAQIAKVAATRCGLSFDHKRQQIVVDFNGGPLKGRAGNAAPALDVGSDKGKVSDATIQPIPGGDTWRLSFQLDPGSEKIIELHARLLDGDKPISETWAYRWTP